jgi:hypothetical protein
VTSLGSKIMTDSQRTDFPTFTEHRVQRDRGSLYVRDFPGSGAAFVLLHGFPNNSHIYDDLIPHLASAGRVGLQLGEEADLQGSQAAESARSGSSIR